YGRGRSAPFSCFEVAMRPVRVLMAGILFGSVLPALTGAQADTAGKRPDITGKWAFTVQSDVGSGTPTVTFAQKGDSSTGRESAKRRQTDAGAAVADGLSEIA